MSFSLIFLFLFINLIIISKQDYTIIKLDTFSAIDTTWNISEKYIYYVDIQQYNIGDENVLQVLYEDRNLTTRLYSSELDESILNINIEYVNIEDYIIRTIPNQFSYKMRYTTKEFYREVIFKKNSENRKFFVVLFEPVLSIDNTKISVHVSRPIPTYNIYNSDIESGNIYSKIIQYENKIEKYFRFNFINIPLIEENLLLFLNDKIFSTFYYNNITSLDTKTRIFVLEKNTTNDLNHTIYLSLLGEGKSTKLQIAKDSHDIKYFYSGTRDDTAFYIEKLNCKKDFYIFENYFFYDKIDFYYHLHVIPFYGDYELLYYENIFGSNIFDIFKPNNEVKITKIKKITSYFNILKLSCKTPTLLRIKYLSENSLVKNITEGYEMASYMHNPINRFDNFYIYTDSIDKKYILSIGFLGENELYNVTEVEIKFGISKTPFNLTNKKNLTRTERVYEIFHEKSIRYNKFEFLSNEGVYIKIYLISNQFYKNVVEGLTIINSDTKAIAFKVRKDIIFDYFIVKVHSYNKSNIISCDYELKIVNSYHDISNGKVSVGINKLRNYNKNELIIQFSNPYNKFDIKFNDEEHVYLLAHFVNTIDAFPLFIDIKYYYNDKIITLKKSEPKILLSQKVYKIFGEENEIGKDKVLININKCNLTKNYFLKTYYEYEENIIGEEFIKEKRKILIQDNLYNNTKIFLYSNDSSDISNNYYNSSSLKQASYYENGDIYMNYFPVSESLFSSIKFTEDYSIAYEDDREKITLNWNDYIINDNIIDDLKVNYSLYILPSKSPINSICQMSLIPPNISLINRNKYTIDLSKGDYKVSIMASVINEEFPIVTFYDFLKLNVSTRINILFIISISVGIIILIIVIVVIYYYCKKKSNDLDDISRRSNMISMAKLLGYDEDEQEVNLKENKENKENKEKKENKIKNLKNNESSINNSNISSDSFDELI